MSGESWTVVVLIGVAIAGVVYCLFALKRGGDGDSDRRELS